VAALPSSHVHGVAVNPADGHVYLGTHDGLLRMTAQPERVSPVIDLMGFTVAGPDHFYASGHPGPGTDLPNPVGLIESRDGGKTWTPLSRQGRSDFHALTASAAGVVGFDGTLRASADGATWTDLTPPADPYALAASPDGQVLLATSQRGPVRSTDAGATWQPVAGAPLLQVVDWADAANLVAGVTPDGQVAVSADAGATWSVHGQVDGPLQAVAAAGDAAGGLRILLVNEAELLESADGGATFAPYRPAT
jgi:photosystem II stability/assembly factor-like uncharacterized protein